MSEEAEWVRRYPDQCCAAVTRNGESEPCDKVAVAVTASGGGDDDEFELRWWPACAYHTRKGRMVPLADLIRALDCSRLGK